MKFSIFNFQFSIPRPALARVPCLAAALLWLCSATGARANVYATHLRFNGCTTNVVVPPGGNITIAYILNEAATAGVTIEIKSGGTSLRTITLTNGSPGTASGANSVVWDGRDAPGNSVASGTYSISITAAATGYDDWTRISDDANPDNYVYQASGIAVNKNTNSLYYGRVFVANSQAGPSPAAVPGDRPGLQKWNADGSPADEGVFGDGGWPWEGISYSPWKVEVPADDKVYVGDFSSNGLVLSFDQTIGSNSLRLVLRADNWPNGGAVKLSGPFISGPATNSQLWMADTTYTNGVGIHRWNLSPDGAAATNDLGATIVQAGPGSDLDLYPYDVAVDRSNAIYTIQNVTDPSDPSYRVFRFAAPGSGLSETNAAWKIGSGDDSMRGAYGVAADPTGTLVAVAFYGVGAFPNTAGGAARVFLATNGAEVATLTPATYHYHTDVAWDNVGNLYTLDGYDQLWRVYSPPGTNQAATVVTAALQIGVPPAPPLLSSPSYAAGQFQFNLDGQPCVGYIIQASADLQTWIPVATNSSPSPTRLITLSAPLAQSFYRALVGQ